MRNKLLTNDSRVLDIRLPWHDLTSFCPSKKDVVCGGQLVQLVDPYLSWYVPLEHGIHCPANSILPLGHLAEGIKEAVVRFT